MKMVCQPRTKNQRRNQVQMKLDVSSLAHTKWECKYHIVFAPKYRRQIIYGKIKQDIGQMIRKLCQYKGIEIHEAGACKDHIHMLVSIPPKYSVSQIMGYLKGKSSLMIYEKYANLKYKYGNRYFWCRGYYVSTVGRNRRAIEEYIRNQLQEPPWGMTRAEPIGSSKSLPTAQFSRAAPKGAFAYLPPLTGSPVNGSTNSLMLSWSSV